MEMGETMNPEDFIVPDLWTIPVTFQPLADYEAFYRDHQALLDDAVRSLGIPPHVFRPEPMKPVPLPLDPFLQEIVENPSDIGLRLIYADWLEERGDPRGEFIRVQCELAELPEPEQLTFGTIFPTDPERDHRIHCVGCRKTGGDQFCRYCSLISRERELLEKHGIQWLRREYYSLFSDPSRMEKSATFRRGFVEVVSCTCADWLKHGPQIVRAQPVLEFRFASGPGRWLVHDLGTDPIAWARGPHAGLAALPPLKEQR